MIEKKYFFIINPIAGNGRGLAAWKKIRKTLQEQGISYTHKYTFPNQESNQEMILNTVDENHIIVVLGGDGTINEILNILIDCHLQNPLSYIACGSGNDFARAISLPSNPLKAWEYIHHQATIKNICVGKVKINDIERYFLNNVGIGFDARIVYSANHSKLKMLLNKIHLGALVYASFFLKALIIQKFFPTLFKNDGTSVQKYKKTFLCTITNHPFFGGGVKLVPEASVFNQSIDALILEKSTKLGFLINFLRTILPLKNPSNSKNWHHQYGKEFKITINSHQPIHIDGEASIIDLDTVSFDTITFPFLA
ncbi:diacylglycerol kinase [Ligilactobacillus salivarius]|uniref:diacylglycerol/lipid kinase family protein n=1 Tax=Ligilactobacillus salivarius TaxID=1624 RepID=UPI0009DA1C84|nr:YegS/Rv2252/BmrU family lipid kinase [Ligilactobacillus salivarius]OQQ88683.1 diacylglycerol kinase [Ligilactobacillus salivarius]